MNFTLRVWRQLDGRSPGEMVPYQTKDVSPDMSFLEMLDLANETLIQEGEVPIAFDHDCREGICGMCSLVINGVPHGPERATTACQLHMRKFRDGDTIEVEPWRASAFPVIRDLVVDRRSLDRIIQAGGYVSVNTGLGSGRERHSQCPRRTRIAPSRRRPASACGACVAACPNASASLFVAAKAAHLAELPQGRPERLQRTIHLVEAMDREGFGSCTNHYECEAVCPKSISVQFIADLNSDFLTAALTSRELRELPPPVEVEE